MLKICVEYFELNILLEGWMDGWTEGKAGLNIAYSNQKPDLKARSYSNLETSIKPILLCHFLTKTITMADEIPQHFHERLQQQHCLSDQLHNNFV